MESWGGISKYVALEDINHFLLHVLDFAAMVAQGTAQFRGHDNTSGCVLDSAAVVSLF